MEGGEMPQTYEIETIEIEVFPLCTKYLDVPFQPSQTKLTTPTRET